MGKREMTRTGSYSQTFKADEIAAGGRSGELGAGNVSNEGILDVGCGSLFDALVMVNVEPGSRLHNIVGRGRRRV